MGEQQLAVSEIPQPLMRSQPINKSRCVGLATINKRHRIGHDTPHRYFLTVTGEMKPQDAKARASSPVYCVVTDADLKRPIFGCVDWGVLVVYALESDLEVVLQTEGQYDVRSVREVYQDASEAEFFKRATESCR